MKTKVNEKNSQTRYALRSQVAKPNRYMMALMIISIIINAIKMSSLEGNRLINVNGLLQLDVTYIKLLIECFGRCHNYYALTHLAIDQYNKKKTTMSE